MYNFVKAGHEHGEGKLSRGFDDGFGDFLTSKKL
jgi:hypothetical protein